MPFWCPFNSNMISCPIRKSDHITLTLTFLEECKGRPISSQRTSQKHVGKIGDRDLDI
jgi:hypothetical protein